MQELSTFYKQNTILVSHNFYCLLKFFNEKISACISTYLILVVFTIALVSVKIFVYSYNPQITNARIFQIYKSNITLNKGLSVLVGISEAIRVLFFKCYNSYNQRFSSRGAPSLNNNNNNYYNNNKDKLINLKIVI